MKIVGWYTGDVRATLTAQAAPGVIVVLTLDTMDALERDCGGREAAILWVYALSEQSGAVIATDFSTGNIGLLTPPDWRGGEAERAHIMDLVALNIPARAPADSGRRN